MILWLEDKKIRYYTIDDREPLRDIESRFWVGALKKVSSIVKGALPQEYLLDVWPCRGVL